MAGRPMPIDSPPPPEALGHEISGTFQTPPRRGSDPVPPDYDRQYQIFVKLVRQFKKDQISISERSLLSKAEACLMDEISSETSLKDVAKQFVERYNAESIPTEAHPAFSRGDLSIKAEAISRMLLQTIPVPFTDSQWNSLRRAYALSVFGIVSAPCFRNLPGSLNQDLRLDVANDPITYKRSEDILVPPGIKLENIHSNFRSDYNDNDTRFFWLLAIRTLHEFVPTSICLPEEQFVAGLWSPLLQSCLRIDVDGTVRLTPTFQLKMTDVVPGLKSERFIDLAYHLKSLPGCPELDRAVRIPILMVEVSAYEVPHDYDHKDFRKLSACMAAALVALLGIARGLTKDQKEKLRLFGMFVGGHSCIPCVMVPVEVDSNRASFVFYCDPGKQFNLLQSEREPIPPAARQEFISEPVHYDPTSLPTLEELEAATAESLKEKGIREQSCESLNADELASRLRPLVAFCSTINTYATFLHQVLLDLRPPQEPYSMWKDATVLPQSRTEHKRSTPGPEKRTMPSTNPSKRSREVRMQHVVDADGSTTVIKEKPQSCRKEADLLGAAQGDGIVVLKGFEVPSGTCSGGCILYEELLEVVDLSTLTSAEMGLLLIRLIIDGLAAIETLRSAGIVHRDISPNNIMYSFEAQAWRLTDFDSAEYLSCAKASCLIGTEGYIAPESTACGDYSHASDLWSLGRTIAYFTTCIENELWCRDGEPDELDIENLLLRSQTQICLRLLDEDPALRVIAPADQQFLSVGHTFFENWVARTVVDDRAKRIRPRSPPTSKRRRRSLCHPRGEALLDPDQQTIVSADCLQSTTTQVQ